MARYTCGQGHSWDAPIETTGVDGLDAATCPVCGSAVNLAGRFSNAPQHGLDQLPPPPRAEVLSEVATRAEPGKAAQGHDSNADLPTGYEFLDELGRGGMGVVYKARQRSLNRVVAVKTMLAGSKAAPEQVRRFRQEAEVIARLQHPNIVQIHDISEPEGRLYIILEFVEGGSLADKLRDRPMPSLEAARLLITLTRAVHAAHRRGIVHRDLKPANILLTADATPKITDFGLAKLLHHEGNPADPGAHTHSGVIMGTPSYMAPEQAEGRLRDIGPATDVYALGAILYEVLTGSPPFRGSTAYHTLHQVVSAPPRPPSEIVKGIPRELEAICMKCLHKEPAQRYASALELEEALVQFVAAPADETTVQLPTVASPAAPARRYPKGWMAAGAAGLVLLLAVCLGWYFRVRSSWEVLTISTAGDKFDRLAFPTRHVGYAASRQAIYKTADGGTTWTRLPGAEPGRVHCLHFQDVQMGWLGTDRLLATRDGGQTWTAVALNHATDLTTVSAIAFGPEGWALAGGTRRSDRALVLFQRKHAQAAWELLDASRSQYWGGPAQTYRQWFVGGIVVSDVGRAAIVLFKGSDDGGAVLQTTDAGATWTPTFTTGTDLYRMHFADRQRGWLAGNHGALWTTRDGGKTWTPQSNPEKAIISTFAFDAGGKFGLAPLWQGKVLTTTGDSWRVEDTRLGESMPGAAVVDAGCAFVLGADGRIARRLDPRFGPNR